MNENTGVQQPSRQDAVAKVVQLGYRKAAKELNRSRGFLWDTVRRYPKTYQWAKQNSAEPRPQEEAQTVAHNEHNYTDGPPKEQMSEAIKANPAVSIDAIVEQLIEKAKANGDIQTERQAAAWKSIATRHHNYLEAIRASVKSKRCPIVLHGELFKNNQQQLFHCSKCGRAWKRKHGDTTWQIANAKQKPPEPQAKPTEEPTALTNQPTA
jgi:rubrerythrin